MCLSVYTYVHVLCSTLSVSSVLLQLDELTTQFSSHSSEADLRWEDATPERLQELQLTKEQLSERAQQVGEGLGQRGVAGE